MLRQFTARLLQKSKLQASSTFARAMSSQSSNVRMEVENGVAIITLDQANSKVNTLNKDLFPEFEALYNKVENDASIRAAVLISGKSDGFIAGADINMLKACKSSSELESLSKMGQEVFNRLERGKPIVAAIHGACMGGGTEFALACHYRIATESPKTVMSLPEVMLGLLPGSGGTQRLPKLIGLANALPIMLTGQNVKPKKAKKLKMVDQLADPHALRSAAIQAARGLADGTLKPNREPKGTVQKLMKWALEDTEYGRNFVFKQAKDGVMKKTLGVYPAPLKIIDVLKGSMEQGGFCSSAGYDLEAKGFGELGMTDESKALVSIFQGQTACKKNPLGKPKSMPKKTAVLGAGLMGAGIVEVTAPKGFDVVLKDANNKGLGRGLDQIYGNMEKKVKRRRMDSFTRDTTMSRVMGVTSEDDTWKKHFKDVDIVFEAVFENLELKHKVIQETEAATPDHCIFATNTSAIPIGKLAEASKRPEKLVGMHYFSPVDKMPLLEIIRHDKTDDETVRVAFEMGLKQGKTPIVVKDVPGFYVNRSLGPYSDEGLALLLDGADIETIDKALLKYGFPVGPMTLVDEVGIDVAASVGKTLRGDLGVRVGQADPALLESVIQKGWLGRKTGKGLHVFPKGKGKKTVNPEMVELIKQVREKQGRSSSGLISVDDIQKRMAYRFVNEAALCLQDGIVDSPVVADIGAVFGIGFPPFRGGPFRLVDHVGAQAFVDTMHHYRDALGEHFTPAPILLDYAKQNKKFHQD